MDLTPYRSWLVLLHILSVFAFLPVHGVSMTVALRLRHERDRARIGAYLDLSNVYLGGMYGTLGLLLLFGILSGIAGAWWTSGRAGSWSRSPCSSS